MRCNKIFRVEKLERRALARNLVRYRNQIMRRKCESGSVQHLAYVAGRLRSTLVMMKKSESRCDKDQKYAAQ
jgi:hypothetical protein